MFNNFIRPFQAVVPLSGITAWFPPPKIYILILTQKSFQNNHFLYSNNILRQARLVVKGN